MSASTVTDSVWINQNGLITCRDHGGDYLTTAIADGDGPEILTPLDHWLRIDAAAAVAHDLACETCKRTQGTTTEKTFEREEDARAARRTLIDEGRRVSLLAMDPSRDLYVFDLYDK